MLKRSHSYPTKILQFGEGNFLRCFIDWQIDILNEKCGLNAGITIVRPRGNSQLPLLNTQDGLYTTLIRGLDENGQPIEQRRLIQSVNNEIDIYSQYNDFLATAHNSAIRFIFSNTTEAGIAYNETDSYTDQPPQSFPAKLTVWLHQRFLYCPQNTVVILPCELIDDNGQKLLAIVKQYATLWQLDEAFSQWLNQNTWCDTLVDRIVPGLPPTDEKEKIEQELGYTDPFMVTGEYFHLFVIKGPEWLQNELPFNKAGLNVIITDNIKPYKQRKVAILNGGHTMLTPVALLSGVTTVGQAMDNPFTYQFLHQALFTEVIPTLKSSSQEELKAYANDVIKRFKNPYVQHQLSSIALNSMAKFKERVWLSTIDPYHSQYGKGYPLLALFALAATMRLYKGDIISLNDSPDIINLYHEAWANLNGNYRGFVVKILGYSKLWGTDLSVHHTLVETVSTLLHNIDMRGVETAYNELETLVING